MHVLRRRRGAGRDCALAECHAYLLETLLHGRKQVRSRADGRIEDRHVVVGEAERLIEVLAQDFRDERRLGLYDRRRREVDAALLPQLRVVGGEKVLVEVEPEVSVPALAQQRLGIDRGDGALEQANRHLEVSAGRWVGEPAQDLREQAMSALESIGSAVVQVPFPFDTSQQERIGHGLCVGIAELRIVGVREEVLAPLVSQRGDRRGGVEKRGLGRLPEKAGQRSEELGAFGVAGTSGSQLRKSRRSVANARLPVCP